MATKRHLAVGMVGTLLGLGACSEVASDPAPTRPVPQPTGSVSSEATPSPSRSDRQVDATRCSDVRLPEGGLGHADFYVDRARGLLAISFSDLRRGTYRTISYTVRFRDDPSCATDLELVDVIERVLPRHQWEPEEARAD